MEKNTGKVREKSGNFVIPEKWEPWFIMKAKQCNPGDITSDIVALVPTLSVKGLIHTFNILHDCDFFLWGE